MDRGPMGRVQMVARRAGWAYAVARPEGETRDVPMAGDTAPLAALAAATAAGLIVGVERGWSQRERPDGSRVSGLRTFGLLGLTGGLAGFLPDMLAAALVLATGLLLVVGYRKEARPTAMSATTAVAGVLTLGAGISAVRLGPTIALATAAAAFALLSARGALHRVLRGLSELEIEATARFLLVALVVLPLLPDQSFGPYDAWNPRKIWLVVVLVAGLSFAGYVAARRWGATRGILLVAVSGAVVSSTAVTVELARRLRSEPEARPALTAGIALASIVMFVRVQLLTLALVPRALPSLALTMAPATVVSAAFAFAAWRKQDNRPPAPVKLGNPLDFKPALGLAALVAGLSLVARWALEHFGNRGIAAVLALTGMMDVDAGVITLSGLPHDALTDWAGGMVLAGTVLANTLIKAIMAITIAPGRDGLRAALPLLAALAASAIALAAMAF
ncbi:DUF4010 domain-containing protein [Novosphingobium sp. KCTC 2891]|uniref:MgtC/SapB family protein n=1 Tax=Novosphingobium sp. KCTC 2891 TaxID=2989730 RepID=UPI0022215E96|nr:DUF4010 domain-containing protein [Novosphingobium sp. KCTC 2891]MCW1384952.1 DUF4010 domain-containing protein [Novosphingobium sp. KCTC 2891]